jgi:hypothetical protein
VGNKILNVLSDAWENMFIAISKQKVSIELEKTRGKKPKP